MTLLSRINITTKIVLVIALIGTVIAGCVFYAQGRMTDIDAAYTAFLEREAQAAADERRINRYIFELNYSVYRAIAETDTEQMRSADQRLEAAMPKLRALIADVRRQVPAFSAQVDTVDEKVEAFLRDVGAVRALALQNQNDKAIDLVHRTIDPVFDTLTASSMTLADSITAYIRRAPTT